MARSIGTCTAPLPCGPSSRRSRGAPPRRRESPSSRDAVDLQARRRREGVLGPLEAGLGIAARSFFSAPPSKRPEEDEDDEPGGHGHDREEPEETHGDLRRDPVRLGGHAVDVDAGLLAIRVHARAPPRNRDRAAAKAAGTRDCGRRARARGRRARPAARGRASGRRTGPRRTRAGRARRRRRNRMTTRRVAARARSRGLRLASRESSSRNGRTKWKSRITMPRAPHPPRKRARYQWISSGMFPDQTIRYWEKLTYAQIIMKANIILPRSCRIRGPRKPRDGLPPRHADDREGGQRERAQRLAHHEDDAVHRREPVGLERHDPVDGGPGHGEGVEDEASARELLELAVDRAVVRCGVLPRGESGQEVREQKPHGEREGRAHQKEGRVEVQHLLAEKLVLRDDVGVRPLVEPVHPEDHRQKEEGAERQRTDGRLEGASDRDAPRAARQVLEHQDGERTDGQAVPEDEGQKVGAVELRRPRDQSDDRHDEGDRAHGERPLAEAGDGPRQPRLGQCGFRQPGPRSRLHAQCSFGGGGVESSSSIGSALRQSSISAGRAGTRGGASALSRAERSPAGTSASVALCESCRTRR